MSDLLSAEALRKAISRLDAFRVGDVCRVADGAEPLGLRDALGLPEDAHHSDVIGLLCAAVGELYEEIDGSGATGR